MEDVPRPRHTPSALRLIRRLRVSVESGPDRGDTCAPEGGGPLSIGTGEDNALVLGDPIASRYHVELRRTATGVQLTDLGSRAGTWVGELRVERAVIPAGTRLHLGATTLLVEDGGTTVVPVPAEPLGLSTLVGESEAIIDIARQIHRLAYVDSPVLIQGEPGVGKQAVVRALHDASPRRSAALVIVDCGSLPAAMIAALLFGREPGGAGAFERASGGTLLLTDVSELPLELQPALLEALERRVVVRLGGARTIPVDVRVIAAARCDLRAEVNAGRFAPDLYQRLGAIRLFVPPLRDRPEDIAPLVRHFVRELTGADDLGPLGPSLDALRGHPWIGNVRELRDLVESAVAAGGAAWPARAPRAAAGTISSYRDARDDALHRFESDYLRALLGAAGGDAGEASRLARVDRPHLLTLLRRHGLRP